MSELEIQGSLEITDYIDVAQRAVSLGCSIPTSLAILPRNFATADSREAFQYESETPTVRILWRKGGVTETPLQSGSAVPQISEKGFDAWVAPLIFVSFSLASQNPYLVTLALNVISDYLIKWFKGHSSTRTKLDIVVETKSGTHKRISFDGPVEGLAKLPAIIREVSDDKLSKR